MFFKNTKRKKIRFDQGRSPEKSPIGADGPDDPTFQRTSLSSTSRTVSRLLVEIIKPHRIFQSGLDHNSKFSLGPRKIISAMNHQEVAWKTMATFPKNGL